MHTRILRFLFALPVALAVTAGLYYLLFPRPSISDCYDCYPWTRVAEPPPAWSDLMNEIRTYCDCGWPSKPTDPSNSHTRGDKASPTPPDPVECGEDCNPSRIKIAEDVMLMTPTAPGVADNYAQTYPKACRAKGVSGAVTVDYDITPEGAVANARIVSSPDRCFNAEVLREISKYHYQPQTDETGRATWRRGVRQTFTFELTD